MPKVYFIFIGGKRVPVDEVIYRAFMRPVWAAQWQKRKHVKKPIESLDRLMETGFDAPACQFVEDIIEDKIILEMLMVALQELSEDEHSIIDALFYQEKSERQLAHELGVSQNAVNYHKNKIIEKLKKYLKEN